VISAPVAKVPQAIRGSVKTKESALRIAPPRFAIGAQA
jgi:hypothetical protein